MLECGLLGTSYRQLFDEGRSRDAVKHLACRAHPGTEHGAMCRSLVMRVVTVVKNRLTRSNPADSNNTNDQQESDGVLQTTHHIDYRPMLES